MKFLLRKILSKFGLQSSYKTEMISGFLISYNPKTDIGRKLYRGVDFEKEELEIAKKYIKNNSTILDIGANIGLHSMTFSKMADNITVIAFEPQPKTFRTLLKNITQNNLNNIIPLNLAISNSSNIVDFYVMSDDAYSSLIDTGRKELTEKIKTITTTVDGLLGNTRVDFVKIDVEGLELNVLHSLSLLIQKNKPVIFCEIYKGKIELYNPNDTINFLVNLGYRSYRVIEGDLVELNSNELHNDQYYNYFFIPNTMKPSTCI